MTDKEKLIAVLRDVNEDVDFAGEKALVDEGLIDSFDIIVMIAAIDENFGVHIEVADIEPENFNSAEEILRLIDGYRGKK